MDGQRFDQLTRSLIATGSRRTSIKTIGGGIAAALVGLRGGGVAAQRECGQAGDPCQSNSQCCGVSVCRQRMEKTQGGEVEPAEKECCRPKGASCNPRGVFTGRNNCCDGLRCAFGAKRGSTCVDGGIPH